LAARGGNHIIASSYKICSEIVKTRPDLLEVLATPNRYFDHRGKFPDHRPRAVVFYHDGHLIMNYIRYLLVGFGSIPRSEELPDCTPIQVEALDYVETVAKKYRLILDMQPGDMTFVNNWAILHSRDAFEDDANHVRYLVRIWLRNEKLAWSLPPVLEHSNKAVYYDSKLEDIWNIVPEPRLHFELFQTLAP
ncbi:Clavaminate synthase-like protein, partial [Cadophora sp. DSE1049]